MIAYTTRVNLIDVKVEQLADASNDQCDYFNLKRRASWVKKEKEENVWKSS